MFNLLSKMICVCTVTKINYEKATVRVSNHERGIISSELQVLQTRARTNTSYELPSVGEEVLCLFLPTDNFVTGFVLGSLYNDEDTVNSDDKKGMKSYRWADGTYVKYNEETKKMETYCVGDIAIESAENISVKASKNIAIESAETINIFGKDINITGSNNVNIEGATSVGVKSEGNLSVEGAAALTLKSNTVVNIEAPLAMCQTPAFKVNGVITTPSPVVIAPV